MGKESRAIEGKSAASVFPKNDDDRCAPVRPRGIQYYNCVLYGHAKGGCPRGQNRNLNRIGRTKVTPPSYRK
jgi:hypothetical protein